jgi:hypothetical protein
MSSVVLSTTTSIDLTFGVITRHLSCALPGECGCERSLNHSFREAQPCVNTIMTEPIAQHSDMMSYRAAYDRPEFFPSLPSDGFSNHSWYNLSNSRGLASICGHALSRPASVSGETDSGMTMIPCFKSKNASGRNDTCKARRDEKPHVPKGEVVGPLKCM